MTDRDAERLMFKEKEALSLELVDAKQKQEALVLEIDSVASTCRLA